MHLKTIIGSVVGLKALLAGPAAFKAIVGTVLGTGFASAVLAAATTIADATNFSMAIGIVLSGLGTAVGLFWIGSFTGWAKGRAAMRKIDDDSRRDSLSAQLDEVNQNLEKSRKNQHEIRDQLEILTNDNYLLRDSLRDAESNFVRASHELLEATAKNDALRAQLFSLKGDVNQLGRDEAAHHKETKVIVGETKVIVGETKQIVVKAVEAKAIDKANSAAASGESPAVPVAKLDPPRSPSPPPE